MSKNVGEGEFKPRVGPIDFEVLRHRLWQINDEQGRTIINVSGSPVAAEANDFNVGITNAAGEIVCLGTYMAPLILAISAAVQNAFALFGEGGIEPDSVYLTNDPWLGAQHQNDVCLIAPLFWEGKLVSWVGSSIHQVDVGGNVEGSWNPLSTTVFQEAPLYDFLKVVRQGKIQPEVVATYTRNSRLPHMVELDLRSQIAGINVAKERLLALIREYGLQTMTEVLEDCLDHQEILLKRKLRQIPDGEWHTEDYLDHDGHGERLTTVRLKLTKKGDRLVFDYRGSDPQTPGFVNCTRTSLCGKTFLAIAAHLCNDIPWGGGILRAADILSQEGSVVDARFPAPVSGAPVNAGWSVQNTAGLALSQMLSASEKFKGNAMAVWVGSSFVYNVFGTNQYGKPFGTMMLSSTLGGGGARSLGDGYDNSGPISSPAPSVINVESAELKTPFLYLYRKRAADSGGAGKYRGGVAALSCLTPYDVESLRVFVSTLGTTHSSGLGLAGGYPGGGSNCLLKRKTPIVQMIKEGKFPQSIKDVPGEEIEALPSKYMFAFQAGDMLETVAHGGGGFGDPLERDRQRVQQDIRDGCVSPEYAQSLYGAVLGPADRILPEATEARREERRQERLQAGRRAAADRPAADLSALAGSIRCRHCQAALSGDTDASGEDCLVLRSPFRKAGPWIAVRLGGDNPRLALREYVCPSCGALLFVDVERNILT